MNWDELSMGDGDHDHDAFVKKQMALPIYFSVSNYLFF